MKSQYSRKVDLLSSRLGFYLVISIMLGITALVTICAAQKAQIGGFDLLPRECLARRA